MRYLKALIKTIKQMDKDYRHLLYAIALLIPGVIGGFISCVIESILLSTLSISMVFLGLGFMFEIMWDDTKDDIKKFFKRVKSNIE